MDNEKLRKGLEGVMSKAGWSEDDIIDFVRDNLKDIVEIDREKLKEIIRDRIWSIEYKTVGRWGGFDLIDTILCVNPIKLKEESDD